MMFTTAPQHHSTTAPLSIVLLGTSLLSYYAVKNGLSNTKSSHGNTANIIHSICKHIYVHVHVHVFASDTSIIAAV